MHSQSSLTWNSNLSPFVNLKSLASLLDLSEHDLVQLSKRVDDYWKPGKLLKKKSGEPRQTHDAKPKLKETHIKIKNRILSKIEYPRYLHGGIKDARFRRSIVSNARVHCKSKIIIEEDVSDFFPSVTADQVFRIWRYFFNFSDEVSNVLTKLVTFQGCIPQGWVPSGYLANLALWDVEHKLVSELRKQGFSYTRFVDDITLSSRTYRNKSQIQKAVQQVYSMLKSRNYQPKRKKHEILPANVSQKVTGIQVNGRRPTMAKDQKNKIRAVVHRVELAYQQGGQGLVYRRQWERAASMVGTLSTLNPGQGRKLRERLQEIRPI